MPSLAASLASQIIAVTRALEEIATLTREADVGEFDLGYDRETSDAYLVESAFRSLDVDLAAFYGTVLRGKPTMLGSDPEDAETGLIKRFEENREDALGPYVDPNAEHRLTARQLGVGGR